MLLVILAVLVAFATLASMIVLVDSLLRGRNAYRMLIGMRQDNCEMMASATVTQIATYRVAAKRNCNTAMPRPVALRAAA